MREERALGFLPGKKTAQRPQSPEGTLLESDWASLPQPEDEEFDDRGRAKRHSDSKLQTQLTSEGLQRCLLNILYLALGMLHWYEADNSGIGRDAPLLLIPRETGTR